MIVVIVSIVVVAGIFGAACLLPALLNVTEIEGDELDWHEVKP